MNKVAAAFLQRWESTHVKAVARSQREKQAQQLAQQCREDAAEAGISSQDLEAAADGDLTANMIQALDAAEFQQMARDQWAG